MRLRRWPPEHTESGHTVQLERAVLCYNGLALWNEHAHLVEGN